MVYRTFPAIALLVFFGLTIYAEERSQLEESWIFQDKDAKIMMISARMNNLANKHKFETFYDAHHAFVLAFQSRETDPDKFINCFNAMGQAYEELQAEWQTHDIPNLKLRDFCLDFAGKYLALKQASSEKFSEIVP